MELFRRTTYQARSAEIAAVEAPLTDEPYLPENVDITVFYGGHDKRKDFSPLSPLLADADIYVPEITAWTIDQVALLSRIAQGDKVARKKLEHDHAPGGFNPFVAAETEWLLDSGGIRLTVIDYAATHAGADEILDHFDNWRILDKVVPSFRKTLDNIGAYVQTEANLEDYREDIMVCSIGPRLETLISQDTELRQKERVKVVIQQGAAHTYFFHKLARLANSNETVTVKRVFDDSMRPIVFDHFDRLARTYRAGIEVTQEESRELAMRVLARTALRFDAIPWVFKDSDYIDGKRVMPGPEEMVERFSVEAITTFHKQVVNNRRR